MEKEETLLTTTQTLVLASLPSKPLDTDRRPSLGCTPPPHKRKRKRRARGRRVSEGDVSVVPVPGGEGNAPAVPNSKSPTALLVSGDRLLSAQDMYVALKRRFPVPPPQEGWTGKQYLDHLANLPEEPVCNGTGEESVVVVGDQSPLQVEGQNEKPATCVIS